MSKKIVNKELPVVQHIDPLNEKVLCGKFEEIQSHTSATPRYLTRISHGISCNRIFLSAS